MSLPDNLNFTRSPYYYQVSPDAAGSVTSTSSNIYIWTGNSASQPATATYTISKTPLNNSNVIVLDLAQLVDDYIDLEYNGTLDYGSTYFCNIETTFRDSTNTQIGSVISPTNLILFAKGYGDFQDGINPSIWCAVRSNTSPDNWKGRVYMSDQTDIVVPSPSLLNLPIYADNGKCVELTWQWENDLGNNQTSFFYSICNTPTDPNNEARDFIQYGNNYNQNGTNPSAPMSSQGWENFVSEQNGTIIPTTEDPERPNFWCPYNPTPVMSIKIKPGGTTDFDTINVETRPKDKNDPIKLVFINKYGVLEEFWLLGNSKENLNTNSDTFKRNLIQIPTSDSENVTYNSDSHQYKTFAEQGRKGITIDTGWRPESNNEVLTQIFMSQKLWIVEYQSWDQQTMTPIPSDPKIEPVNLKSKTLAYKTHKNEKVINYTLQFEYAYDVINKVR